MSKQTVKVKSEMERDQAVAYLEDLIAGMKAGKVSVQHEDQLVTLCPEGRIKVKVEASIKKGKEKFELELSWRKEEEEQDPEDMKVSPSEPEAPALDASSPSPGALPAVSAPAIEIQPAEAVDDEKRASVDVETGAESGAEKAKPAKKAK